MKKFTPLRKEWPHLADHYQKIPLLQFFLTILVLIFSVITLHAQTKTVTGVIKDETGSGMQGVSIMPKGSEKGVTSGPDGSFLITLPSGINTIVFSYIGYEAKELQVTASNILNVTLNREPTSLNDVVVIAYGTTKRKDFTGAVSSVKMEGSPLANLPTT
ncbi:MAG: carboxypeptidase-like regulatory domain-containing protein, partial [Bacteroidota bacterium]